MFSQSDERVKDYWKLSRGKYIIKMIDDAGLEEEAKKLKTVPLQLNAFVLSDSRRNINSLIHANNGFYTNVFFTLILTHCILKINTGKN